MSLNKAIEHNKEYRQKYKNAKSVSKSCRNHGGCVWCCNNRTYQGNKLKEKIKSELKDSDKE